ncbi:MAG: tRNA lysidine(34) synthetase TilS [Clostridia bacterium]|nr:tRNA lysidine(34) synthetase TilS [Clostridia bacterium]
MVNKIENTIKKYDMISYEEPVAVAFSGGADSMALLDILYKKGYKVSAIHVNHMIRGAESDSDEEFCRCFCKERNIPFYYHRIDVPAEAKKSGEGLEEAARRLRYAAIEETVKAQGISRVATAHHADDNAETVIFNIVRGSGAKGGCGIPPVRDIYIRPLIDVTRDEIVAYCKENSLEYVTDSTNLSTDYTRNYIRHEIMPRLKEINPLTTSALGRFSSLLRADEEALESLVPKDGTDRQTLAALPDALLSRYIRKRCEEMEVRPSLVSVQELIKAIRQGNRYLITDMGKDIVGVCDRNSLIFRKKNTEDTQMSFIMEHGFTSLEGIGVICVAKDKQTAQEFICENTVTHVSVAADKISGGLHIRSRREGDSYRYGGMTHSLKKLFNSRKIPVEQRSHIPLVCDEEGIIWIPGFMPADRVKNDNKQNNVIYIVYNKRREK